MRLAKNPVYRKVIVPWYDSETACFLTIIFMGVVFLFALAGVSVARETVEYHGYVWVPVFLMAASAVVIVSTAIRLIKRYAYKFSKE